MSAVMAGQASGIGARRGRLGRWLVPAAAVVLLAGLGVPVGASESGREIGEVVLSSGAPGELTVSWEAPVLVPFEYRVSWAREDLEFLSFQSENEAHRGNEWLSGDAASVILTGLDEGATYKVQMRARFRSVEGKVSASPWTDEVTAGVSSSPVAQQHHDQQQDLQVQGQQQGLPDEQQGSELGENEIGEVVLSSGAPGELTVSWEAPVLVPFEYRVSWAREDLEFLSFRFVDEEAHRGNEWPSGDATSVTLSGLQGGATYKVQMRARFRSVEGKVSASPWTAETTAAVLAQQQAELNRVLAPGFVRSPERDVLLQRHSTHPNPTGVWSDGVTMWIADDRNLDRAYGYELATGARDADKDISTLDDAGNDFPRGLWSDGTTIWVADAGYGQELYAYDLDTGARDADKDINASCSAGNCDPMGLWSDGTTMWIVDWGDAKIYAYELATGNRDADKDFSTRRAAGNGTPRGLWSDGLTLWVDDAYDDRIYAYDLATGNRRADLDFNTLAAAGNGDPVGLWSDGTTMWVVDHQDEKIYAYNMPVSSALKSLSISGVDFGLFQTGIFAYSGTAAAGTMSATVTAAAAFADDAAVTVAWEAADGTTGTGTSVTLSEGENTITVTSSYDADGDPDTDNADVRTYTVTVTVPPAADNS